MKTVLYKRSIIPVNFQNIAEKIFTYDGNIGEILPCICIWLVYVYMVYAYTNYVDPFKNEEKYKR